MKISGLMKLTLLDFPGRTACTVFTSGCNFRCPFCHNASLVRGEGEDIGEDEFFAFLAKRTGMLDGVCITGGEPLMHPEVPDFARKIREMGFLVKLDTNGSYPDRLDEMLSAGLVDYVAMDIKSSPEGYERAAGGAVPMDNIRKSIALLINGKTDYEFRTTAAKGVLTAEDFEGIGRLIGGAKRYFIQGFVDSGDLVGDAEKMGAFTPEEMNAFLKTARTFVPAAELRGV